MMMMVMISVINIVVLASKCHNVCNFDNKECY
jgi:hypothetical protein